MLKRVLIAIDDTTSRNEVVRDLTAAGYDAIGAKDGFDAWTVLRGQKAPRIVILDTALRDLGAYELCRRVRDLKGDDSFILVLASRDDQARSIDALEAGADGVVEKPAQPRELRMRLAAGMRGRRLATSEAPSPNQMQTYDPSDEALAGTIIARKYQLDRIIGRGGMGTVWQGTHLSLRMPVAIKFIKGNYARQATAKARFELEARATAALRTKYAVKVFDCGVTVGGVPYLVMEYLEGPSLLKYVESLGPLSFAGTVALVAQAAQALGEAHARGIIHRDVKPDNMLMVSDPDAGAGTPLVAKLIDFGVAKVLVGGCVDPLSDTAMPTSAGIVVGTPNFMAPEQLRGVGQPDVAADLWALATCAFTAITGRIPFEGTTMGEVLKKVCEAPLPVPSETTDGVSPDFDAWFARACDRNPAKRFRTARELATSLACAYADHANETLELTPSLSQFVSPFTEEFRTSASSSATTEHALFDLDDPLSATGT